MNREKYDEAYAFIPTEHLSRSYQSDSANRKSSSSVVKSFHLYQFIYLDKLKITTEYFG